MTVLVGLLCSDGVVIGSDSSATFAATPAHMTIEQKNKQKVFVIGNCAIVAGTGAVGLGQRFVKAFTRYCDLQDIRKTIDCPVIFGKLASQIGIKDFGETNAPAQSFAALVGYAGANKSFGLVELEINGFQPEVKTDESWFVSMGSGQPITDPFLALLRSTLFRDQQPTVTEGVFAAVWALQNAIDLNTGGIDGPIQISVIRQHPTKNFLEATSLSQDELQEHKGNVDSMCNHIASYRNILNGTDLGDVEAAPAPPPSPQGG